MTTRPSGSPDLDRLRRLPLPAWRPVQQAVLSAHPVERPAVPAIDVHNHLGRWLSHDSSWVVPDVDALLATLDDCAVRTVVNLDGLWGDELSANVERYDRRHPGRFLTFCHLDWPMLADADGERLLIESLEDSARRGARGVKVWKHLGLQVRDGSGDLVLPDDPRVVSVLTRAGELGLPVLIHVADPKAFFEPLDERNERRDELLEVAEWWFGDPVKYPAFDTILAALEALVVATPGTTYLGAHVGCVAEDLDRVAALMDTAPNWHVDLGGRLAEVGRQPRRFRRLVETHPDRVLFGTDAYPPSADDYRVLFRFLETDDESFDYAPGAEVPPQGRWTVSGAALPTDLLPAVYAGNAARILGC
jgi:predicted TIM-barrel fold metal-dependent hydrolase